MGSGTAEASLCGEVRSDITASNAERLWAFLVDDRVVLADDEASIFRFFAGVSETSFDPLANGLSKLAARFCVSAAADDDGSAGTAFVTDADVEAAAGTGVCEVGGIGAGAGVDVDTDADAFGVVGKSFSRRAFRNTATSAPMLFATGAQFSVKSLSTELKDF